MSRLRRKMDIENENPLDDDSSFSVSFDEEPPPPKPKIRSKSVRSVVSQRKTVGKPGRPPKILQSAVVDVEENEEHDENDMEKILQGIGAKLQKTISAKKRKMEELAEASLKVSNKKLEDFFTKQHIDRQKARSEYEAKIEKCIAEWQNAVQGIKTSTTKIQQLFVQQQKLTEQALKIEDEKLKLLNKLTKDYTKELNDLENQHKLSQCSFQEDLKSEMTALQKKMLKESQQKQMENVRKSFTSIF